MKIDNFGSPNLPHSNWLSLTDSTTVAIGFASLAVIAVVTVAYFKYRQPTDGPIAPSPLIVCAKDDCSRIIVPLRGDPDKYKSTEDDRSKIIVPLRGDADKHKSKKVDRSKIIVPLRGDVDKHKSKKVNRSKIIVPLRGAAAVTNEFQTGAKYRNQDSSGLPGLEERAVVDLTKVVTESSKGLPRPNLESPGFPSPLQVPRRNNGLDSVVTETKLSPLNDKRTPKKTPLHHQEVFFGPKSPATIRKGNYIEVTPEQMRADGIALLLDTLESNQQEGLLHLVIADHLHNLEKYKEAVTEFEEAAQAIGNSPCEFTQLLVQLSAKFDLISASAELNILDSSKVIMLLKKLGFRDKPSATILSGTLDRDGSPGPDTTFSLDSTMKVSSLAACVPKGISDRKIVPQLDFAYIIGYPQLCEELKHYEQKALLYYILAANFMSVGNYSLAEGASQKALLYASSSKEKVSLNVVSKLQAQFVDCKRAQLNEQKKMDDIQALRQVFESQEEASRRRESELLERIAKLEKFIHERPNAEQAFVTPQMEGEAPPPPMGMPPPPPDPPPIFEEAPRKSIADIVRERKGQGGTTVKKDGPPKLVIDLTTVLETKALLKPTARKFQPAPAKAADAPWLEDKGKFGERRARSQSMSGCTPLLRRNQVAKQAAADVVAGINIGDLLSAKPNDVVANDNNAKGKEGAKETGKDHNNSSNATEQDTELSSRQEVPSTPNVTPSRKPKGHYEVE